MRMLPDFQRNCHKRGLFAASSLLLLLATQTVAQSGRRAPKPTQPPVVTPETDKKPSSIPTGRELSRKASLIVGKQNSSKRLLSEDTIFGSFVQQLAGFKNVSTTSVGELKHDAAVKRAKSETEAIVVLLEFDVDEFQNGTYIVNSPDLDVKILVFAAGKKKFEGYVRYQAVGGPMLKKDNWPSGPPIKITTEAVGIEAAEQVRDWLIVEERRVKTTDSKN
jgi:hypothetical protein